MADKTDDLVIGVSTDLSSVQRAIKKLDGDIARAGSQIERRFSTIGRSIDKAMPTGIQERINKMTGIAAESTKEWTGALAQQGKEMERLRAKFNPVFSTITNYKASIGEIRAAHRLGAISADEMAAAIGRERTAALASIAAIKQRNAALSDTPNVGSFNTANIAAQFQDIGVTAAMGMSPIQIALQQGTQLSAVLNTMGGTQGAIAGLGAAFAQIINPVSLVTIGVVGLTAAALQYFSTFAGGSDETAKSLEEQAAIIQKVADRWKGAIPALQQYADELERTQRLTDDLDARNIVIGSSFSKANEAVAKFFSSIDSSNFSAFNEGMMELVDNISRLQIAGGKMEAAIKAGKDTSEDFKRVQELVAKIINSSAIPATGGLRDSVAELGKAYLEAAKAAGIAASEFDAAAGTSGKQGRLNQNTLSDQQFNDRFGRRYADPWEKIFPELFRKGSTGGRSSGISEAERERKAIDDVIASLQFEQEQLGRTGTEQRIYNELKRAGVDISSSAGQQIAGLVVSLETERQALEKSKQAIEARNQSIEYLFSMGGDALAAIVDGSEKAEDAIKRLAVQLALAAAQAALLGTGPLAGLFGGGGLFGGISPLASSVMASGGVGLWSEGGYTGPGGKYQPAGIVHKGEYVVPKNIVDQVGPANIQRLFAGYADGGLVGAPRLPSVATPAAANQQTYAPQYNIDARGAEAGVETKIRQALQEYDRGSYSRWVSGFQQAKKRNVA